MIEHSWDISPREAMALQRELAREVRVEPLAGQVRTVAGVDCAFAGDGGTVLAAAVLCDARSMAVLGTADVARPCRFPYVPGLLSFREAPAVIAAVRKLGRPDLLMCDGQGVAHPRGVGLASHVGLWVDVPTIGVAKSRLCGEHRPPGRRRPAATQLRLDGRVIGKVVRTRSGVRPLYVSVGHRITLDEAVRWVLRCTRGCRGPEPVRRAHLLVTQRKRLPPRGPGRDSD
jgi:deoxyribonuclease V